MLITHPRSFLAALGLLAASVSATAGPASARSAKPLGPVLTVESKACNTGAADANRSVVVTAAAVLRDTGDGIQMRFTVQQRDTAKAKWRSVFAKTGDLGTWATSTPGTDGLRYTKTINGLAQGTQYRVAIDARGTNAAGKVVTRTTRRTFTCIQPQISARLTLARATVQEPGAGGKQTVRAFVRNAGREATTEVIVTVRDATTQGVLGEATFPALPALTGPRALQVPIGTCPGTVTVSVQQSDSELTSLAPDQSLTLDCADPGETVTQLSHASKPDALGLRVLVVQ
jgi:hypothetical protein